jgi:hypothetical protein
VDVLDVATGAMSTRTLVGQVRAHPDSQFGHEFLAGWVQVTGGALVVATVLGSLFAISTTSGWGEAVLRGVGAAAAAALGYYMVLIPQDRPGGPLCTEYPCDLTFGLSAAAVGSALAVPMCAWTLVTFGLLRLAQRFHGE